MNFIRNKALNIVSILAVTFLTAQSLIAAQHGQVVRIQCNRTGHYLTFDQNNDVNGDKRLVFSSEADDNSLWIIKGPLNAPIDGTNPYDRWNCVFGEETATNQYDTRLEHVITGLDARFGNFLSEVTDRVYPYTYILGPEMLTSSDAIHRYNAVLNLHGNNHIMVSNEYLCQLDTNDAALTQDAVEIVDTFTIMPVYMMIDDFRELQGSNLLDALRAPAVPAHDENQSVSDKLVEDVVALIGFYTNEKTYSQIIDNAFAALVNESDINQRIAIVEALGVDTTNYNNEKANILSTIVHPTDDDLIVHINDLLMENQTRTLALENDLMTREAELSIIEQDLNAVGASSVTDLTSKVDQLVAGLNDLW